MGFTKLDDELAESSTCRLGLDAVGLWALILSKTRPIKGSGDGLMRSTPSFFASITGSDIGRVRELFQAFEAPDPDSRTPEHDGRKLARTSDGWRVVNYKKYRESAVREAERERISEARQETRQRKALEAEASEDVRTDPDLYVHVRTLPYTPESVRTLSASASSSVSDPTIKSSVVSSPIDPIAIIATRKEGQVLLFADETVEDRQAKTILQAHAANYLKAIALRKHGSDGASKRTPTAGTIIKITERIEAKMREGFPSELLVALPVLVKDEAIDFMLGDPTILLRSDVKKDGKENPDGKNHALRYEAQLGETILGPRQASIAKIVGVLDWLVEHGVKVREAK